MQRFTEFEAPKKFGIYCIYNSVNHKRYIGSAIDLHERLTQHLYELNHSKHFNLHLQRSFDKYKVENFWVEILEEFDSIEYKKLLNIEDDYIIKYDTINPEKGYNKRLNSSFPILSETSKAIRKQKHDLHKIKVLAFNAKTGEFYKEYESVTECALDLNDQTTNVSGALKTLTRKVKGYTLVKASEYIVGKDYKQIFNRICTTERIEKQRRNNIKNIPVFVLTKNTKTEYFSISEATRQLKLKKDSLSHMLKRRGNIRLNELLISLDPEVTYDSYDAAWLYEPGVIKNQFSKNK